jgi:arginine deiminase
MQVLTVRDILSFGVASHMGARVELEELAMKALSYRLAPGTDPAGVSADDAFYASDAYKRRVLEHMSIAQLIDTLLINPTVDLKPSGRDTGLTATYEFKPLSNLVYTRDQQITTAGGVVMGRLRSPQRALEVDLMAFCFHKLGLPVLGGVTSPGYLEGGDFFPAGPGLALLGIGLRSNMEAAAQLMAADWLGGVATLAIVRDDFDQAQDRMHLDCVFSILGEDVCLMLAEMMGPASPTRRTVDEWVRDPGTGQYTLASSGTEFAAYMASQGFHIIPVPAADQLAYGCNCLNLGGGKILSVHAGTARAIVRDPKFRGDVQVVDFGPITSMYGAVHCASQVVKRTPR